MDYSPSTISSCPRGSDPNSPRGFCRFFAGVRGVGEERKKNEKTGAIGHLSYAEVAHRLAEKLHLDASLIHPVSCQTAGVTYAPRHTTLAAARLQGLGMRPPHAGQVIDQLWMPAL
jgi:hypothetical protein